MTRNRWRPWFRPDPLERFGLETQGAYTFVCKEPARAHRNRWPVRPVHWPDGSLRLAGVMSGASPIPAWSSDGFDWWDEQPAERLRRWRNRRAARALKAVAEAARKPKRCPHCGKEWRYRHSCVPPP